jgi:hypothetical protein
MRWKVQDRRPEALPASRRALERAKAEVASFDEDEEGLNIIEIILIVFVAVLIILGLYAFFNQDVWDKVKKKIDDLLGKPEPT